MLGERNLVHLKFSQNYGLVLVEIIIIYCAFSSEHFPVTSSSLARNLLVTFEGYLGLSLVLKIGGIMCDTSNAVLSPKYPIYIEYILVLGLLPIFLRTCLP